MLAMNNNLSEPGLRRSNRIQSAAYLPPVVRTHTSETVSKIREQTKWETGLQNEESSGFCKPLRLPPIDLTTSTTLTSIPAANNNEVSRVLEPENTYEPVKRKESRAKDKNPKGNKSATKSKTGEKPSKEQGKAEAKPKKGDTKNKEKGSEHSKPTKSETNRSKSAKAKKTKAEKNSEHGDCQPLLSPGRNHGASYPVNGRKSRTGSNRKRKRKKRKEKTGEKSEGPQGNDANKLPAAWNLMQRVPQVPNSNLVYRNLLPPINPRIPSPTHYKRNMPRMMYKKGKTGQTWAPETVYDRYILAQYQKQLRGDDEESTTDDSAYDTDKKKCTGSDDVASGDIEFWSSADLDFRPYKERKYEFKDDKLHDFMKTQPRRRNAICEVLDKELELGLVKFCEDMVVFTIMQTCF